MSKYDDLEMKAKAATAGAWRRAATTFNGIVNGKFSFTKENVIATAVEKRDAEFIASANPQTVLELIEIAKAAENMLLASNHWEQQTLALRLAKLLGNPGVYATSDPEPPEAA